MYIYIYRGTYVATCTDMQGSRDNYSGMHREIQGYTGVYTRIQSYIEGLATWSPNPKWWFQYVGCFALLPNALTRDEDWPLVSWE